MHGAKLFVVDEVIDGGFFPADRAVGIGPQGECSDLHTQCVEAKEAPYQRLTPADYELDGFQGLDDPDQSRKDAEHKVKPGSVSTGTG